MVNKKCPLFCYLEEFICLSFANKQEIPTIVMAKIQIKSENPTRFGGIFLIMEQFNSTLSSAIDSALGLCADCTALDVSVAKVQKSDNISGLQKKTKQK